MWIPGRGATKELLGTREGNRREIDWLACAHASVKLGEIGVFAFRTETRSLTHHI